MEAWTRRLSTWRVAAPALVVLAVFTLLFEVTSRMVVRGGDPGALDLQQAFTTADFEAVLLAWGDGVATFKLTLILLDYTFPIVYAVAFASLLGLAAHDGPMGQWLTGAAVLPYLAGGLDWFENSIHLWLLRDVNSSVEVSAAIATSSFSAVGIMAAAVAAGTKYAAIFLVLAVTAGVGARRRRWWPALAAAAVLVVTAAAWVAAL